MSRSQLISWEYDLSHGTMVTVRSYSLNVAIPAVLDLYCGSAFSTANADGASILTTTHNSRQTTASLDLFSTQLTLAAVTIGESGSGDQKSCCKNCLLHRFPPLIGHLVE